MGVIQWMIRVSAVSANLAMYSTRALVCLPVHVLIIPAGTEASARATESPIRVNALSVSVGNSVNLKRTA